MLSRIFALHTRNHLRLLSLSLSPHSHPSPTLPQIPKLHFFPRHRFSTHGPNGPNGPDFWKMGQESDNLDDIFGAHDGEMSGVGGDGGSDGGKAVPGVAGGEEVWEMRESGGGDVFEEGGGRESGGGEGSGGRGSRKAAGGEVWAMGESGGGGDVFSAFGGVESGSGGGRGGGEDDWLSEGVGSGGEGGFRPWKMGEEGGGGKVEDVFGIGGESGVMSVGGESVEERKMVSDAEKLQLDKEEQALLEVLKGPDRAFGDLIAASGITDAMLDSLIALKNFEGIEGLPPLSQIEDERYMNTLKKSTRYEMELQKQEEAAKARVRQIDEKGRAYGTGRRKCSIARVWIQPGEGKFCINDKEFDVYFPTLDNRAALLRPFSETKTLGLWDVKCTVKGGGVSGQVGAIRLGISRALQNWEPGLRPSLREAGFLTRDPRVVERKKPGKAKARKSFQWVKR